MKTLGAFRPYIFGLSANRGAGLAILFCVMVLLMVAGYGRATSKSEKGKADDKALLGALKFWYRFAGHGNTVYLNGHQLINWTFFAHGPYYDQRLKTDKIAKYLKKGTNTLAVYCCKKDGVAQIDSYIEGVKKKDFDME